MSTSDFILRHRTDDVATLALQLAGRPDAAFLLRQIEGWQRLRHKVPTWAAQEALLYPPRLSLEQCSGEETARYKAQLAARLLPDGGALTDLTGGLGVDFAFLAPRFRPAVYVERNEELCRLARHNFPLLGVTADVVCGDAVAHLRTMLPTDLLLLDPARRDGAGRKTVRLADCEPDAAALLPLLTEKARHTLLKLSPMLDWRVAVAELAGRVTEVHVVGTGGECKELLLVVGAGADDPVIHCAADHRRFSFTAAEEAAASPPLTASLHAYLYEPDATLLKAGAFRCTATRFGLQKLHANSHLYTGDALLPDFPGRRFRVLDVCGFGRQEQKNLAGERANLTVRNFPTDVAALRKRLRLREGGDAYWFATTLADERKVIVRCEKIAF